MTGLNFVRHNVTGLNDTTNDVVDQNKSTLNLTTNGHQFGNVFTNLSEGNHAKQNETDGRHQYAIVWVLLGLCVIFLCMAFWYFSKKKWHKIVHFSPVPKSQDQYNEQQDVKDK